MKNQLERPRIVVSDVINQSAHAALERQARIVDVNGTDREALIEAVADADALIVRSETRVDRELIEAAPRLRVIARAGVGVDNIDVEVATRAGILVLNTPGANRVSAAEHTIALMLAIARQLTNANESVHAGRWDRKHFQIFDLAGKTVGIVGLGRVGGALAQRLASFETTLLAHDPYVPEERFEKFGAERVSYDELLMRSDIVTYHCPLTTETYHYLSDATIPLLKPGAIVINCARGEVVDHDALAAALDSCHVAAAGVDVYPIEPLTASPLHGRPNVILTPHIGGSSREAQATVGAIISATTLAALRAESVPNAINLPAPSFNALALKRLNQVATNVGHLLGVLQSETPDALSMIVWGQVSRAVSDLIFNSVLSGGLRHWSGERTTPVNARMIASELQIGQHVSYHDSETTDLVEFFFESQSQTRHFVGLRWDGVEAGIYEVDHFAFERPLSGQFIIVYFHDTPGMVGAVGTILGKHSVNIAGVQLSRHSRGGDAIMVLNVDDLVPDRILGEIVAQTDVDDAYMVNLAGITE